MIETLLIWSALVLAGVAVAAVLIWLGHAVVTAALDRRSARLRPAAHAALAGALGGGEVEPALVALRRLPPGARADVLFGMAEALAGEGRRRLDEIARLTGILGHAERDAAVRSWARRLRAARLATAFGVGGEGFAERLLADSNAQVRAEVARWASRHPSRERIEALVAMLRDPDPLPRFVARDGLVDIGAPGRPAIGAALAAAAATDYEPAAAEALLDVASSIPDPAFIASATALRRSPEPAVRAKVARLCAATGGAGPVALLEELARDPDPGVRAAAIAGAGSLGHWPAAATAAALLLDPSWPVRAAAARALLRMGPTGELLLRRAARTGAVAGELPKRVLDESQGRLMPAPPAPAGVAA